MSKYVEKHVSKLTLMDLLILCTGAGILCAGAIPIQIAVFHENKYQELTIKTPADTEILKSWMDWGFTFENFAFSIVGTIICGYVIYPVVDELLNRPVRKNVADFNEWKKHKQDRKPESIQD